MSTMRWMTLACAVSLWLASSLAACSGEPRPSAEPAPEPAAPAPAPEPAPAPPVVAQQPVPAEPTPEELPVREDFEAEAEQQITLANYRAELDKLEKEIEADN